MQEEILRKIRCEIFQDIPGEIQGNVFGTISERNLGEMLGTFAGGIVNRIR